MENLNNFRLLLTELKNREKSVNENLKTLPSAALTEENVRGETELVASEYNPRRKRVLVRCHKELLVPLIRSKLLSEESECLSANIKLLENLIRQWRCSDADSVVNGLRRKLGSIPENAFSEALKDSESTGWADEPYEMMDYKDEERRHITSRGVRMRSKSEVLIAELLYSYNVDFHYEEILYSDAGLLAPDFTIRRKDGKLFYWEHMGLTSNEQYIMRQFKKIEIYYRAGIVPWDNLIISYDDIEGNVDTRSIRSEIENKLLI